MKNLSQSDKYVHQKHQWLDILPSALYRAEQVREFDRQIIAAGTPGIVLMRRAAAAVFAQIQLRWPGANQMLVLCGKANNAGDGYLVARFALEKKWQVTVVELAAPDALQGDAKRARDALLETGSIGETSALSCIRWEDFNCASTPRRYEVIVDALLGTGFSGEVSGAYARAIAVMNQLDAPVISVDIPSGLGSNTGCAAAVVVEADVTVSFIGLKRGLFTGDAANYVGELVFDDLAAGEKIVGSEKTSIRRLDQQQLAAMLPSRRPTHYKNRSGHLLIIGGDHGMPGSVALAASAALRAGAGLVTVATRPEHSAAVVARQPEIMLRGVTQAAELEPMLAAASAIVIGPGLGGGEWALQLVAAVDTHLQQHMKPVLLDADALNAIAKNRQLWRQHGQQEERQYKAIMTPHPGEAKRLLQSFAADADLTDRFAMASQLQREFGGCIVLKGAGTLIADADQISVCPYGNAALATAGTGDVLSGFIGAYLAQGLVLSDAATLGVGLHALAADSWVTSHGLLGMTAGDLPMQALTVLNNWMDGKR